MLGFLKNHLPLSVKNFLIRFRKSFYLQLKKKCFSIRIGLKHKKILSEVRRKRKVKVVFLAIHESVWKVDNVFRYMLADEYFEPVVLVCPDKAFGYERQEEELRKACNFFKRKGYPLVNSKKHDGTYIGVDELNPDLIFFTNPHELTYEDYYSKAYKNYLSCYVPYFYLVTSHGDDESIYNQYFHNAMWKIFMPHRISFNLAKKVSANNGSNCVLVGYPACEQLFEKKETDDPWKYSGTKKRVIFAPHHTIDTNKELNLSNFLLYAEFFRAQVEKYKGQIQWCFKPHPMLKPKLYLHPKWGRERTDAYYKFWESGEFTQISYGDYESLFLHSDAMIHDCGSFLAEYLHLRKPVLYLVTNKTHDNLNDFGKAALKCCSQANSESDIIEFLDKIISEDFGMERIEEVSDFLRDNVEPFFAETSPSKEICNILKSEIKGNA